jgi:hypothetical protein
MGSLLKCPERSIVTIFHDSLECLISKSMSRFTSLIDLCSSVRFVFFLVFLNI